MKFKKTYYKIFRLIYNYLLNEKLKPNIFERTNKKVPINLLNYSLIKEKEKILNINKQKIKK